MIQQPGPPQSRDSIKHSIVNVEYVIATEAQFHLFVVVGCHLVKLRSYVETITGLFSDFSVTFQVVLHYQRDLLSWFSQFISCLLRRRFPQIDTVELQDTITTTQSSLNHQYFSMFKTCNFLSYYLFFQFLYLISLIKSEHIIQAYYNPHSENPYCASWYFPKTFVKILPIK